MIRNGCCFRILFDQRFFPSFYSEFVIKKVIICTVKVEIVHKIFFLDHNSQFLELLLLKFFQYVPLAATDTSFIFIFAQSYFSDSSQHHPAIGFSFCSLFLLSLRAFMPFMLKNAWDFPTWYTRSYFFLIYSKDRFFLVWSKISTVNLGKLSQQGILRTSKFFRGLSHLGKSREILGCILSD